MREPIRPQAITEFLSGLQDSSLRLQVGSISGQAQFYPRALNLGSVADPLYTTTATGKATLMACTVVRSGSDLPRPVPYWFAMIRLEEGPRILGILDGDPATTPPRIGCSVFVQHHPGELPPFTFRLADGEQQA